MYGLVKKYLLLKPYMHFTLGLYSLYLSSLPEHINSSNLFLFIGIINISIGIFDLFMKKLGVSV